MPNKNEINVNGLTFSTLSRFLDHYGFTNRQFYKHIDWNDGEERYNIAAAKLLGLHRDSAKKKRNIRIWGKSFKSLEKACDYFNIPHWQVKNTRRHPEEVITGILGMKKDEYFKQKKKNSLLDKFLYNFKTQMRCGKI